MKKKYVFLFFCLIFWSFVSAQYDSLLHQPFYKRVNTFHQLEISIHKKDSLSINKLQAFFSFANSQDNLALKYEAKRLKALNIWQRNRSLSDNIVASLKKDAAVATKNKHWISAIRAYNSVAYISWKEQNYERLFVLYNTIDALLEEAKLNLQSQTDRLNYSILATMNYTSIGEKYYFFKDYDKAVHYLEKTILLPGVPQFIFPKMRAWNSLGLVYREIGELKKSSLYFKKVIDATYKNGPSLWKAIARGNLGYNYSLAGEITKAVPLFKRELEFSTKYGYDGGALAAAINLANIQLKLGKLEKAGNYLRQAQTYQKKASNDDKLHYTHLLYKALSEWYATTGNKRKAVAYIDSMQAAQKKNNANFNTLKLMRAKQEINEQRLLRLEEEKHTEIQKRNVTILIAFILFIGMIVFYVFRNKYYQRKQEVKDLTIKNTKEALGYAKNSLNRLTQKIKENNQLIQELQQIKKSVDQRILEDLKRRTILTNEDWAAYQILFEKAYPDYLKKLKENHLTLTPAEWRCLCLEKLNLKNNEMATVLGVSSNSIMVTKHRIRKKLGLENQKAMQSFVKNI